MAENPVAERALPQALAWLADAPLFIDADLVGRFYDAIISPEYHEGPTKLELTSEAAKRIGGQLGIEAKVAVSGVKKWLASLLPSLDVSFKASGQGSMELTEGESESLEITLHRIDTPQRRLVQLAIHYVINHGERLLILQNTAKEAWPDNAEIVQVPRALAFVDLAPGTKIIPTAAEFADGVVMPLYLSLLGPNGEDPPKYPEAGSPADLSQARKKYWAWFSENVTPSMAMRVVEKASTEKGRIRWIDYRVMLTSEGDTAHLHVCPAGNYDTGVLAYNLVKRAEKHGVRIVGTLKSEPDINVMALYEK